jgi:rhamnogalacturonan endolyase
MALSDTRQRSMPSMNDRITGQILAYKEAVLLTKPSNPQFRGEVSTNLVFLLFLNMGLYFVWFFYLF